jgi:hypothetical protein
MQLNSISCHTRTQNGTNPANRMACGVRVYRPRIVCVRLQCLCHPYGTIPKKCVKRFWRFSVSWL